MATKSTLSKSIQVVTFLFAAFGGFLLKIAPPEGTESRYAVGISSFAALFVLFFISAVTKKQVHVRYRNFWLTTSALFFLIALIASLFYLSNFDKMTFVYPPGAQQAKHIAGTELTPDAARYLKENPFKTPSELVAAYGGLAYVDRVWTRESIRKSKIVLTINYISIVLGISTMIFSLTEGILAVSKKTQVGQPN